MSLLDFSVNDISGKPVSLSQYKGKVLMVVNVASKCGLTPQYDGLEKIYRQYKAQGFEVLGFPANEFAGQEPGTNDEIQTFCRSTFGVEFPMFSKIVVKGEGQHPLYKFLTTEQPKAEQLPSGTLMKLLKVKKMLTGKSEDITWNFEKFLVNRKGDVVARFAPDITPEDPAIIKAIEAELAKP